MVVVGCMRSPCWAVRALSGVEETEPEGRALKDHYLKSLEEISGPKSGLIGLFRSSCGLLILKIDH